MVGAKSRKKYNGLLPALLLSLSGRDDRLQLLLVQVQFAVDEEITELDRPVLHPKGTETVRRLPTAASQWKHDFSGIKVQRAVGGIRDQNPGIGLTCKYKPLPFEHIFPGFGKPEIPPN